MGAGMELGVGRDGVLLHGECCDSRKGVGRLGLRWIVGAGVDVRTETSCG